MFSWSDDSLLASLQLQLIWSFLNLCNLIGPGIMYYLELQPTD